MNTRFPKDALILVAGMGTRLMPMTSTMPKCLTEVNGRTILENALDLLEKNEIEQTTLVIGYLGNKIRERIGLNYRRMNIRYVENKRYAETNTSYSLFLGLIGSPTSGSLLLLEGDVFFEQQLLSAFLKDAHPTSTIVQKYHPALDGSFVELKNDVVVDWVHKKVRPEGFVVEDKYKTVNIHKFDNSFVEQLLIPALRERIGTTRENEPLEYVFQEIVKKKAGVARAFDTGDMKWFEIDDQNDLKIAEEIFRIQ